MSRAEISVRSKVFVSYARTDMAFADELVAGLEFDGRFSVLLDRSSIAQGEDWRARLEALIRECDTMVFILSPSSAGSEVCSWELERALALSKRVLPVLYRELGDTVPPAALAALNYVRFDGDRSFMAGLKSLVEGLTVDLDWLREHTRVLGLAQAWDAAGRPEDRLLVGGAAAETRAWAGRRPAGAPPLTDVQSAFLHASEAAVADRESRERQRAERLAAALRRGRVYLAGVGVLTVVASAAALWAFEQRSAAEDARQLAVERLDEATRAKAQALVRLESAEEAAVDLVITQATIRHLVADTDLITSRVATKTIPDSLYQRIRQQGGALSALECRLATRLLAIAGQPPDALFRTESNLRRVFDRRRTPDLAFHLDALAVSNKTPGGTALLRSGWRQSGRQLARAFDCDAH